jgi:predicted DNA-binding protein YlxM (UPF0122 family)
MRIDKQEMCMTQFHPNMLDILERQLSDALRTILMIRSLIIVPRSICQSSLCDSCPKRKTCTNICGKVQKVLAKINYNRNRHENLTGLYPDTLKQKDKKRLSDVFDKYDSCNEIFTRKQWEVIRLYYGKGLTHQQIAIKLGRKRPSISNLFSRAKQRMERYQAKLRRERADYERKIREI